MKNFLALFVVTLFLACGSGENKTSEITVEDILTQSTNIQADIPAEFSALFNPNKAVLRGTDFTNTKEQVKSMESAELVRENENELTYTVDMNADAFADINYSFADGSLKTIRVDIYSLSLEDANDTHKELTQLFNQKYTSRESLWDGYENGLPFTAFLTLINDENNPGVTIIWEEIQM